MVKKYNHKESSWGNSCLYFDKKYKCESFAVYYATSTLTWHTLWCLECTILCLMLYKKCYIDCRDTVPCLLQEYQPRLASLCEGEGRALVVVHLPLTDTTNTNYMVTSCTRNLTSWCCFLKVLCLKNSKQPVLTTR